MKEMNSWEKRCALRSEQCIGGKMDFEEATRRGSYEYAQIFQASCSPTKGKPRDFHYTVPPDYDPESEAIVRVEQVASDLVEIHTQQNHSHLKQHIFRLVVEHGGWRLFERMVLTENGKVLQSTL
jgi:hypothetical protein